MEKQEKGNRSRWGGVGKGMEVRSSMVHWGDNKLLWATRSPRMVEGRG